jgi:hypothetical protein
VGGDHHKWLGRAGGPTLKPGGWSLQKSTGSSTILLVGVPFRKVQAFREGREGRKGKEGKESLEKIDGI